MTGGKGRALARTADPGFSGPLSLIHTNNSPKSMPMRAPARFAMPAFSWLEGVESGVKGTAKCPYETGSNDAWAWAAGYVEGRANAKGSS